MSHITFCQMTQNRLSETTYCIGKYLPYVDKVVIIDGGSIDETIFTLRNWEKAEPKIEFHLCPWRDDFSGQRNNYLKHVPDNTWALVSDPDEHFETAFLENMRDLIAKAEAQDKNMIGIQCRSVSYQGNKRVWENVDNYWKRLLFKKSPSCRYEGNPHEHIHGQPHKIMDTKFIYEHAKQENVTWHRGARNLFCGGGGPNLGDRNPRWKDLRQICSELGINSWHQYDTYLVRGNIDPRIKKWMRDYRHLDGFDGASEHREMWLLYFEFYHPEEKELPIDG